MPPPPRIPSEDEKERFLQYIRSGDDRATAAWRLDYTGTMFRSMCNAQSSTYDPKFAADYDDACRARGPLDPHREQIWGEERESSPTTRKGFTKALHLSEEQLDEFLELVRDGVQAFSAAGQVDPPTSITQINRRASKDSEFATAYREAKNEGGEAYKDWLRGEATRQAAAGDYRALRDQMLIHLEEARAALTTNKHELSGFDGGAIRLLAERHFSELPKEMLDQLIEHLEQKELGVGDG